MDASAETDTTTNGGIPEPDPQLDDQTLMGGPTGQLSFAVGGRKPDTSTIQLEGQKLTLEGQFAKGDETSLEIRIRVAEVHFKDQVDSDGGVRSTTRKHIAKIVGDPQVLPDS